VNKQDYPCEHSQGNEYGQDPGEKKVGDDYHRWLPAHVTVEFFIEPGLDHDPSGGYIPLKYLTDAMLDAPQRHDGAES